MPFFKIETNKRMDNAKASDLLEKTSKFVSGMLGKPEKFVMVSIGTDEQMMFGGSDAPTAFVQLKSIGMQIERCSEFSGRICQFLNDEFGVPADRVFIDFTSLQGNMFGWNGKTF